MNGSYGCSGVHLVGLEPGIWDGRLFFYCLFDTKSSWIPNSLSLAVYFPQLSSKSKGALG